MRSSLLSAVLGLICFIAAQHFVCVWKNESFSHNWIQYWDWDELCMFFFFLLMYSLLSKNNGIKTKQLLQMNIISDVKLKLSKKWKCETFQATQNVSRLHHRALWSLREVKECQTSSVVEHQEQVVCELFSKAVHIFFLLWTPCFISTLCASVDLQWHGNFAVNSNLYFKFKHAHICHRIKSVIWCSYSECLSQTILSRVDCVQLLSNVF